MSKRIPFLMIQVQDQEQQASGGCGSSFHWFLFLFTFPILFCRRDFFFLKKKKSPPPHSTFSHSLHLKGLNYLTVQSHLSNWWVGEGDRDHDSMSGNKVKFGKDEQDGSHCSYCHPFLLLKTLANPRERSVLGRDGLEQPAKGLQLLHFEKKRSEYMYSKSPWLESFHDLSWKLFSRAPNLLSFLSSSFFSFFPQTLMYWARTIYTKLDPGNTEMMKLLFLTLRSSEIKGRVSDTKLQCDKWHRKYAWGSPKSGKGNSIIHAWKSWEGGRDGWVVFKLSP